MTSYLQTMRELVGSRRLFLPGVRAIVLNDAGEVLLQRRTDMPLWGLPAGSVELDESALDALKREVMEETSLEVLDAEPMALYSGPAQVFTYPNGDEVQCFSVAFIVRRWRGCPRADGVEGSQVKFFPLSGLPGDIVEIHRQTLRDYLEYNNSFRLL